MISVLPIRLKILILFVTTTFTVQAENLDSILYVLDCCLSQKGKYEQEYTNHIKNLREKALHCSQPDKALKIWTNLCTSQFDHDGDGALEACNKALKLAHSIGDKKSEAQLMEWKALIYGMCGLPWEGKAVLDSILHTPDLLYHARKTIFTSYYDLFDFFYAYNLPGILADRNYRFLDTIEDSVRKYMPDPTEQAMTFHYSTYDKQQMVRSLKQRLESASEKAKGIIATVLSNKYFLMHDIHRRDYYWALASIYNIRCARHDNEALNRLASRMTETGDWERAMRYTIAAYQDADTYNSRSRLLEIAPTLAKNLEHANIKNNELKKQLVLWESIAALLLIVLIIAGIKIWNKKKQSKLNRQTAQNENRSNHSKIKTLEKDLEMKNEYMTRFLELSLDTVFKVEQIRHMVLLRLQAGETERLQKQMKDPVLFEEFQKTCLQRFDIAFLRLYPNFTKAVNELLKPNEKIELPDTEILNNELRLLAFTRLGITDSIRIATILGVSVNTIYFYRNKLRRRAIDREHFEEKITIICSDSHSQNDKEI